MTRLLHIGDVTLPLGFLETRIVTWGSSGAGKTTGGRVLFEEAVKCGVVAGAVDLKADWYGLASSADGKHAGIPVVVFGGEHGRVPIDPGGGVVTAEIIVDLRQPWVLDLEEFRKAEQIRFLAAFLETLYDRNRKPMVVFFDESDRYAPQGRVDGEGASALGATEDIAKRGRKHGIFPVFITQRNQALNKNVSELCDVAVVYRTTGPLAQQAVLDWFGSKATAEQMTEVRASMAGLDDGEAFICSAVPKLRIFRRVRMRAPDTFDSSATPEIGKERIEPKVFAEPDLEKIRQRIAATVEKVKENDPTELHRRIVQLRAQLARAERVPVPVSAPVRVKVPVFAQEHFDAMLAQAQKLRDGSVAIGQTGALVEIAASSLVELAYRLQKSALSAVDEESSRGSAAASANREVPSTAVRAGGKSSGPQSARVSVFSPPQYRRSSQGSSRGATTEVGVPARTNLTNADRRVLAVLANEPDGCDAAKLALLANYRLSGGFRNILSKLRTSGLIDGGNTETMAITQLGLDAGQWPARPSGEQLREWWLAHRSFGGGEKAVLRVLTAAYPESLTADELCERTGYALSGGFRNILSKLRTAGVLIGKNTGPMRAADLLFG